MFFQNIIFFDGEKIKKKNFSIINNITTIYNFTLGNNYGIKYEKKKQIITKIEGSKGEAKERRGVKVKKSKD